MISLLLYTLMLFHRVDRSKLGSWARSQQRRLSHHLLALSVDVWHHHHILLTIVDVALISIYRLMIGMWRILLLVIESGSSSTCQKTPTTGASHRVERMTTVIGGVARIRETLTWHVKGVHLIWKGRAVSLLGWIITSLHEVLMGWVLVGGFRGLLLVSKFEALMTSTICHSKVISHCISSHWIIHHTL